MVRVAGYEFPATLNYIQGGQYAEVEIMIDSSAKLKDKDIEKIKDADILEEVFIEYGKTVTHVGTYALFGWRRMSKEWDDSIRIAWQTSRETDVTELKEQLAAAKEENETLSRAVIELAQLVSDLKGES